MIKRLYLASNNSLQTLLLFLHYKLKLILEQDYNLMYWTVYCCLCDNPLHFHAETLLLPVGVVKDLKNS